MFARDRKKEEKVKARTVAALAWFCLLIAFGCVVAGLPLMKRGSAAGLPLVILFFVFITAAIVLVWLERKKRAEEQRRLSQW